MENNNDWNSGTFDCIEQPIICVAGFFAPICLQGLAHFKIKENDGGGSAICISLLCCCVGMAMNRQRIRAEYKIKGDLCTDILMYCVCCCMCMTSQEYREVINRRRSK